MAMFTGAVLNQTIAVAKSRSLEPAALLAVVEVESAGRSMELDGKTPCLLAERHVFYRELVKRFGGDSAKLRAAVDQGLAHKDWRPPSKVGKAMSQYRDQGTSSGRLALFAAMKAIDTECAIRSCSWGVGQTMGFLAQELKFSNAIQMFDYMVAGGVPAQIECMIREIERKRLIPKLNTHNWAAFAYGYNGAAYKAMAYDTKIARAYAKWSKVDLPNVGPATKPKIPPQAPEITKSSGGLLAGIAAFFGGLYAYVQDHQQLVGLAVMIIVLGLITYFTLKRRREQAALQPQIGLLSEIAIDMEAIDMEPKGTN